MKTAILSATNTFSGIGFAIPSNTITKIVPTLIEKGYYLHPYLGFTSGTLTSDLAENASLPVNLEGAYVNTIMKNSPADKAGIHGSTTDEYGAKDSYQKKYSEWWYIENLREELRIWRPCEYYHTVWIFCD